MRTCFLLASLLLTVVGKAQPYFPLSGGVLQGSLAVPADQQIQAAYYGYHSAINPPNNSDNVSSFANVNTGTLDNVGWYNGWRFIKSGQHPYPSTSVFKIDADGNTEAAGKISTGFGTQSYFAAGEYLRMGHTSLGYVPYISFNAILTHSPLPTGSNMFSPAWADGSGLIMAGEAARGTIRFLQYKYNNNSSQVNMSSFKQALSLNEEGEVGIGMPDLSVTGYKLAVNGNIAAKRIKVTQGNGSTWPDYVFEPSYKLRPLDSLEAFINQNKHLPDVLSASQVEKEGLDVQDTQAALLKKIEELTLYLIDLKKASQQQQQQLQQQAKEIQILKAAIQ